MAYVNVRGVRVGLAAVGIEPPPRDDVAVSLHVLLPAVADEGGVPHVAALWVGVRAGSFQPYSWASDQWGNVSQPFS